MRANICCLFVVLTVGCSDSEPGSNAANQTGGAAGSASGGSAGGGAAGTSSGGASGSVSTGGASGSSGAATGGASGSGGTSTGGTSGGAAAGGASGSGGSSCRAAELVYATRATGTVVGVSKVAPNPDGSVWVAHSNVSFVSAEDGTVDWGQGSATVTSSDLAVTKFDAQGVAAATLVRVGKKPDGVPLTDARADSDGAVNILGRGKLVMGSVADVYTADGFLGHLNPDGTNGWVVEGGVGEVLSVSGSAVTLAGRFQSAFQLDGQTISRDAGESGWLARLSASGHPDWVQSFGGGTGTGFTVAGTGSLSDGGTIAVGTFMNPRTFGGTTLTPESGVSSGSGYLVKLDSVGAIVSARKLAHPIAYGARVVASGIYAFRAGSTGEAITLDKLNHAGDEVWSRTFNNPGSQPSVSAFWFDVGPAGEVAVLFDVQGGLDVGCGPNPLGQDTLGWAIAKFDALGNAIWVDYIAHGSPTIPGFGVMEDIKVDSSGAVVIAPTVNLQPAVAGVPLAGDGPMALIKYRN